MDFDLRTLTPAIRKECTDLATARTDEQRADAKNDFRAGYSFGKRGVARPYNEQWTNHVMGAIAEYVGSIHFKCPWTKEMGQYKGNKNPDLAPTFQGKLLRCDARGTGQSDSFIYRPRDASSRDDLLFITTNLPHGPIVQVGYIFFKDLTKLVATHPEWEGDNRKGGNPFYWVPIGQLLTDFSQFRK